MLVSKGKRGPDLFEASRVLAVSQEPIGLQGSRKRKTARIETRSRRPGEEPCPGPLIGREAVGLISSVAARPQAGRPKALECHCPEARLLYFPQARRDSTQSELICNNRSYCAAATKGGWIVRQRSCGQFLQTLGARSAVKMLQVWRSATGRRCRRIPPQARDPEV